MPGMSSNNLDEEQFFQRMMDPAMIQKKKYLYIPILLPLNDSHNIANRIPPDPFHPIKILNTIAMQMTTTVTLRCLSLRGLGRQGINSYFRMVKQLIKKDIRNVMKIYCRMGIEKTFAVWKWMTMRTGTRRIRVNIDRVILGSLPDYLQVMSFHSIPRAIDATLLI